MLFIHDKSKLLFEDLKYRNNKIAKAKIVAIAMCDTTDTPATHYAVNISSKLASHFVLDGSSVIKYAYTSTNVFEPDTKWTEAAEKIIEKVDYVDAIASQTTEAFNSNVQITQDFLTLGAENRQGKKRTIKGITIHSTDNEASYARNEREYLSNPDRERKDVGWHLCVDESVCIQAAPFDEIMYHAQSGNETTIGIEMCHTGNRLVVIERTAKLTADLLKQYDLTINDLYRHYDWYVTKPCPSILAYNNWQGWEEFKLKVESYLNNLSVLPDIGEGKDEDVDEEVRLENDSTNISFKTEDKWNAGDHIVLVKILNNRSNYGEIENNLIKFLGDYLIYHELTTSSLWRLTDLVSSGREFPVYYNNLSDFNLLINSVNKYMQDALSGYNNIEVSLTNLPRRDADGNIIIMPFEKDTRDITSTTFFMNTDTQTIEEDYSSTTINGHILYSSKFEDGANYTSDKNILSNNMYERIYPDLVVAPRGATSLYNRGIVSVKDIINILDQKDEASLVANAPKEIDGVKAEDTISTVKAFGESEDAVEGYDYNKQKPIIGKIPNLFDPYPVDDKIAQLEKHFPLITLEYDNANSISENMLLYMINRFGHVEQRMVALENIVSTQMRVLNRLGARVQINCVYYGGQSCHDKYKCIRCLSDDLVNDAAIVTIEQCANCSRYEPVIGQVYDILDQNIKPGEAQIYDDIQASYMTKEQFVSFNRVEEYTLEKQSPETNLSLLHMRNDEDKSYETLLKDANNFTMDWTPTRLFDQSPHIIDYKYDPDKIYQDKDRLLASANKYEDGWREQSIVTFTRPDYGADTMTEGSLGGNNYDNANMDTFFSLNSYETEKEDVRKVILEHCEKAMQYAKFGRFLYHYGSTLTSEYANKTPEELLNALNNGERVTTYYNDAKKSAYFDCSAFVSWIYRLAGLVTDRFTTGDVPMRTDMVCIVNSKDVSNIKEAIKKAIPGDLILYNGHVSIYAGLDEEYEASTDTVEDSKQLALNKIRNQTTFKGIYRHKNMSTPDLKNVSYINIKMTLADFVNAQKGKNVGRDTDGDGKVDYVKDGDYQYDTNLLRNYINPDFKLTSDLRLQFVDIRNTIEPGVITAKMINEYLDKTSTKKIRGLKVDAQYNPVRDENGNLVFEEKYLFPRGEIWMAAAQKSGLSPLYLLTHCALETGWCADSNWTNYSGKYKAQNSDNYIFNAFGIWCDDDDQNRITARKNCEQNEWFTLEKAIVEGAAWVTKNYLELEADYGRQDTIYFMKWHFGNLIEGQNGKPCTHQYATDMSWADKIARMMYAMLASCPIGRENALKKFKYYIPKFE